MNKKVFISYNHSDGSKKVANQIANRLKNMGLKVWFDQFEIKPGDSISDKIQKGLEQSTYIIVIITPKDKQSIWAKKELEYAIGLGKTIIPVLAENAGTNDLPESIADLLAVNVSGNIENLKSIYKTIDYQRSTWEKFREYLVND